MYQCFPIPQMATPTSAALIFPSTSQTMRCFSHFSSQYISLGFAWIFFSCTLDVLMFFPFAGETEWTHGEVMIHKVPRPFAGETKWTHGEVMIHRCHGHLLERQNKPLERLWCTWCHFNFFLIVLCLNKGNNCNIIIVIYIVIVFDGGTILLYLAFPAKYKFYIISIIYY